MMDCEIADDGEVYIEDADIIAETTLDDEDLPDCSDEDDEYDEQADFDAGVFALACSPTNPLLVATGGGDDRGFLWKIGQGDWGAELGGHKDTVTSIAFSSDGQFVASGGFDSVVNVWDASGNFKCKLEVPVPDEKMKKKAPPTGGFEWVSWHPTDHVVLAGSNDFSFFGKTNDFSAGMWGLNTGKTICTGSSDLTLRIWSSETGDPIYVVGGNICKFFRLIFQFAYMLVSCTRTGILKLNSFTSHPYHNKGLTCLAITSDSRCALTGSEDGSVKIVNIKTGKVVGTLSPGHSDAVKCIGLSRSPRYGQCPLPLFFPCAATGGKDERLVIWDLERSSPRSICNLESEVTCLTWIGTSRYVAAGCADGDIVIWDALSGDKVKTFRGHSECIESLSVSCNQDFLVSGSASASGDATDSHGTARVFEIAGYR
ncbi:unnamed protein product [Linum tenue]|uniref:Anaphase-promoting complex subunit 4-like WD40 domain-containing protein n=1 Tax=Linum tenue TaxID=586396 RepID=A0AAV0JZ11_9ROSI|nr:unnamed protein product [Linum tenue]